MTRRAISLACAAIGCILAGSVAAQEPAKATVAAGLSAKAAQSRHRLAFDGRNFSGPAWDLLLAEGRSARFFILGEEHGIAENPGFAAALFAALVPSGYSRLAIETSPTMAGELDRAAAEGVAGVRGALAKPGTTPAFFGMAEEAAMLVRVRRAVPGPVQVLWGLDYEVLADRHLISVLEAKSKPAVAREALSTVRQASTRTWEQYGETHDPRHIYSFAGDPALIAALHDVWPEADDESRRIMDTLEETLAINRLWSTGRGWEANARRAELIRNNFLRYWVGERSLGRTPRVFVKIGASHAVRGRSQTEVYDLGALLPELAAIDGEKAFQLLVLPGAGSPTAVFDPRRLRYAPGPAKDNYAGGLEPILSQVLPGAFTLIDLRPLRPLLGRQKEDTHPELMRVVHGFDAVLVLSGSTASRNLDEPTHRDTP